MELVVPSPSLRWWLCSKEGINSSECASLQSCPESSRSDHRAGWEEARIIGLDSDCAIRQQHTVQSKKGSSISLELPIIQEYGGLCGLNGRCAGESWSSE